MSGSDRQTDRIVRAWLEDGVTQFPDRLLDGVLDQIPDTRQRQPFRLAGRFAQMSTSMRVALASVAAMVVVAGGAYLFAGGYVGAPAATPTPTPTPIATPSPTADPRADQIPEPDIALEPGPYSYYETLDQGELRVTLTVPDGWTSHEGWYVYRAPILVDDSGVSVAVWSPTHGISLVFPDPCGAQTRSAGTTADELVAALEDTNMVVGSASPVSINGLTGMEIRLATDEGIDVSKCAGVDHLTPWWGRWTAAGTEQTLWIFDVAGGRVVVEAAAEPLADATQRAQMEQVLQSVQIEVN
jgi:hypothetical protein